MLTNTDKSISLVPIELEDIETIRKWRNNQNIQKYLREYRLFSKYQKKEWYSSMIKDNKFEMFLIKDNNRKESVGVCGVTYIDWVNRHADIHLYIGTEEVWIDNFYCPTALKLTLEYAFNTLNLNKVWAEIYEIDSKKLNFFKNKGFKVDACLRQHYYYKGKYYDSHILSLLRGEYE
tara:strand:+ start:166 stop:696 length:531 start_codon:yes stop_codon:yes gene_type:complete